MTNIENLELKTTTNAGKGAGGKEYSCTVGGNVN
jgi:hypothetical protein